MEWFKRYYEKRKKQTYDLSNGVSVYTNGIGPFLLNWLLPQFNFRPASDLHDLAYSKVVKRNGKLVHAETKANADRLFLKRMLVEAKRHKYPRLARVFAHIYHFAVETFGQPFYDGFGNKAKHYIRGLFKL